LFAPFPTAIKWILMCGASINAEMRSDLQNKGKKNNVRRAPSTKERK